MQLSGVEVQDLFDFVARRSAGRGCVSQAQIAGARVVVDCAKKKSADLSPGVATNIYIGTYQPAIECPNGDSDCPGADAAAKFGSCDAEANRCWQPIDPFGTYELATSNYLAAGGSGFRVLQRNTTQFDTQVQQRDALIDYIRAGSPGADEAGDSRCSRDRTAPRPAMALSRRREADREAPAPEPGRIAARRRGAAQCRIDVAITSARPASTSTQVVRESERALRLRHGREQCTLACGPRPRQLRRRGWAMRSA
jgi:hypothetical protein